MTPTTRIAEPRPARRWANWLIGALQREIRHRNRSLIRRPLNLLRRLGAEVSDPSIRFELDGTELLLPLSHELPIIRSRFPGYSANLGMVGEAVSRLRPNATMVDIGANVGDSVAIVRARSSMPILCIEGDATFLPYLRHNAKLHVNVEVEPCYVETSLAQGSGVRVERSGGTARLVPNAHGAPLKVRPLAEILRSHPTFAEPALIKIDTDGHDASILRGSLDVLSAAHPVIFFEHDPRMAHSVGAGDANQIFSELVAIGFDFFALWTNTGEAAGIFGDMDLPQLLERCSALSPDPTHGSAYYDVVAVQSVDTDVAAAIAAQQTHPGDPLS